MKDERSTISYMVGMETDTYKKRVVLVTSRMNLTVGAFRLNSFPLIPEGPEEP